MLTSDEIDPSPSPFDNAKRRYDPLKKIDKNNLPFNNNFIPISPMKPSAKTKTLNSTKNAIQTGKRNTEKEAFSKDEELITLLSSDGSDSEKKTSAKPAAKKLKKKDPKQSSCPLSSSSTLVNERRRKKSPTPLLDITEPQEELLSADSDEEKKPKKLSLKPRTSFYTKKSEANNESETEGKPAEEKLKENTTILKVPNIQKSLDLILTPNRRKFACKGDSKKVGDDLVSSMAAFVDQNNEDRMTERLNMLLSIESLKKDYSTQVEGICEDFHKQIEKKYHGIMDAMQNKYSDMVNQIEEIETAVSTKVKQVQKSGDESTQFLMNVINDAERRLCTSSEAIEGRLNGLDSDVTEEIAKKERKQEFLNNNANALMERMVAIETFVKNQSHENTDIQKDIAIIENKMNGELNEYVEEAKRELASLESKIGNKRKRMLEDEDDFERIWGNKNTVGRKILSAASMLALNAGAVGLCYLGFN